MDLPGKVKKFYDIMFCKKKGKKKEGRKLAPQKDPLPVSNRNFSNTQRRGGETQGTEEVRRSLRRVRTESRDQGDFLRVHRLELRNPNMMK